jgi:hypothetical protein
VLPPQPIAGDAATPLSRRGSAQGDDDGSTADVEADGEQLTGRTPVDAAAMDASRQASQRMHQQASSLSAQATAAVEQGAAAVQAAESMLQSDGYVRDNGAVVREMPRDILTACGLLTRCQLSVAARRLLPQSRSG